MIRPLLLFILFIMQGAKGEGLPVPIRKLDALWSTVADTFVGGFRTIELIVLDVNFPLIRCVIVENSDRSSYTLYWPKTYQTEKLAKLVIHSTNVSAETGNAEFEQVRDFFDSAWNVRERSATTGGLDGSSYLIRKYEGSEANDVRWTNNSGVISDLEKSIDVFARKFDLTNRPSAKDPLPSKAK